MPKGGENARKTFEARVKSLMKDVPDLPNFSHFHDAFRGDAGSKTNEGNIRGGFFAAHCFCHPDGRQDWTLEESLPHD